MIIIIEWLICALFFTRSEFYNTHFEELDKADTYVVYLSTLHFIFFPKSYTQNKRVFMTAVFFGVSLRLVSEFLNENVYYFLYYSLVFTPFIICTWRQREKKLSRITE